MRRIQITQDHAIGDGEPPFIIAEVGNNHNGDMECARELIRMAHEVGVDAVKFQKKDIELAFTPEQLDRPYAGPNSFGSTYREHKEFLELSIDQLAELADLANRLGLIFFATPFDIPSVDLLEQLDVPLYKVSSFHVVDTDLLDYVGALHKPTILSTGMSTLEEIDVAVETLRQHHDDLVLCQCTSSYPAEIDDVNFRVIPELRDRYGCLVGYSGHERGVSVSPGAVLMGACVIERHFTLDRTMKGPDHAASVEPEGMALLVRRSKNFFDALGSASKDVLDSELINRKKFRGY